MSPAHHHRHDESQAQSRIETDRLETPTPRGQRALDRAVAMSAKVLLGWIAGSALGGGTLGAVGHAMTSGSDTDKRVTALELENAGRSEREKAMAREIADIHAYLFPPRTTYLPPRTTP